MSLEWYNKFLELHLERERPDDPSIASSYKNMSIVYREKMIMFVHWNSITRDLSIGSKHPKPIMPDKTVTVWVMFTKNKRNILKL